jgi:hypothetical protein
VQTAARARWARLKPLSPISGTAVCWWARGDLRDAHPEHVMSAGRFVLAGLGGAQAWVRGNVSLFGRCSVQLAYYRGARYRPDSAAGRLTGSQDMRTFLPAGRQGKFNHGQIFRQPGSGIVLSTFSICGVHVTGFCDDGPSLTSRLVCCSVGHSYPCAEEHREPRPASWPIVLRRSRREGDRLYP